MILAGVGSQMLTPQQLVYAQDLVYHTIDKFKPTEVISGGAVGIDEMVEIVAKAMGYRTTIYTPANKRWEPYGYKARNIKIAEHCTHMLCIQSLQSKTYGSGWTADYAIKLDKVVWRFVI